MPLYSKGAKIVAWVLAGVMAVSTIGITVYYIYAYVQSSAQIEELKKNAEKQEEEQASENVTEGQEPIIEEPQSVENVVIDEQGNVTIENATE